MLDSNSSDKCGVQINKFVMDRDAQIVICANGRRHSLGATVSTRTDHTASCKRRGSAKGTGDAGNPMFPQVNGTQIKETTSDEGMEEWWKGGE